MEGKDGPLKTLNLIDAEKTFEELFLLPHFPQKPKYFSCDWEHPHYHSILAHVMKLTTCTTVCITQKKIRYPYGADTQAMENMDENIRRKYSTISRALAENNVIVSIQIEGNYFTEENIDDLFSLVRKKIRYNPLSESGFYFSTFQLYLGTNTTNRPDYRENREDVGLSYNHMAAAKKLQSSS